MDKYEPYMASYEGETMDKILPNLQNSEKEHILVTYDECIFYSNDGKREVWAKTGELLLRKKGNGRSIMVNEFLTEACRRLKLNAQTIENYPNIPQEARVYLIPGKNQEGYWTMNYLLEQFKPCCIFPDALVASKMNHFPGGKQLVMQSTTWGDNNQQDMCFLNDYFDEKLRGKPKGMKQILLERGKWKEGLRANCQLCKNGDKDPNRVDCCARQIISLEPDFVAQKGALHEIISTAGHKYVFYPKFHCKLNYIEMYWGATKNLHVKTAIILG
ncbi:hypothetical protein RhiirA5_379360 [Rhizophagus irregularis]|uniref:Uncharacterized protein n=1 Tax=Rhizophagus irregularis TaxID=588596 RepID=A0A2N0PCA5_9GLOM|nr:hypothetical protein RhiirA5_379360 [Rhizophagus irregularis]